ncbi:TetR/AcrR family transcriptional regulator [Streptomyces sp. NBC_00873]|uniref:TetR/AcrR family transcriptional regulator n=1 Tax=unclassified Streptomyces TaxID=2593676 RepID=UPI00386F28A3|nr:TetR/AcrR family transcriptional regulator [Streptomyces sp. NBC_00873]WSY96737.1 TetR/AcrR family transcriptional regulator [Streptomyces sp. NBC_00873]WTA41489.1 TetR/AcrR family transcriptional regulator [Streptomyces sp. NBC_00842]WTA48407.1 TetR/AcrR family transcriptional regulator [Streptomyces sp. NBC_00842]
MGVIRGARERARAEVTKAIKDEARKQVLAEGAARLSLRAVARELGITSSTLYRYFPSRDELLTALIVDAYDAIGAAAERALGKSGPAGSIEEWIAVCQAVRRWALAHPHEYALIYGSPVPGYSAPSDTVGPASRVVLVLFSIAASAHAAGALEVPAAAGPAADGIGPDARQIVRESGHELSPAAVPQLAAVWAQLFGLLSFEVFGRFDRVVDARDDLFDQAVLGLARQAGFRP